MDKQKKIRLGILIGTLQFGGAELQLLQLLKYIDQKKFHPIIFTLKSCGPLFRDAKKINVEVISLNISKKKIIRSLYGMARSFKRHDLDILYCMLANSVIIGSVLGRLARVRHVVGGIRGLGMSWSSRQIWGLRISDLFVSSYIVNSEAIKRVRIHREKIAPDKIVVIPNGLDLNLFPYQKEKKNIIAIVGSLKPIKGQRTFIKAAKILIEKGYDFQFLIIGDGPDKDVLSELVIETGIHNRIKFTGNIRSVYDYLKDTKYVISASAYEGLSNAIIEAMSSGSVVIASNVPSNNELIQSMSDGLLYKHGDENDLVSQIELLENRPDLYARLQRKSRKKAENNYSLDHMVKRTESFFSSLVGR